MKTAKQRVCELQRLVFFAASLLVTLSGLGIKTYYTTMQNANVAADTRADIKEIRADLQKLLRNDAMQDQRERDGEQDRNRIHQQLDRIENRGRDGE